MNQVQLNDVLYCTGCTWGLTVMQTATGWCNWEADQMDTGLPAVTQGVWRTATPSVLGHHQLKTLYGFATEMKNGS